MSLGQKLIKDVVTGNVVYLQLEDEPEIPSVSDFGETNVEIPAIEDLIKRVPGKPMDSKFYIALSSSEAAREGVLEFVWNAEDVTTPPIKRIRLDIPEKSDLVWVLNMESQDIVHTLNATFDVSVLTLPDLVEVGGNKTECPEEICLKLQQIGFEPVETYRDGDEYRIITNKFSWKPGVQSPFVHEYFMESEHLSGRFVVNRPPHQAKYWVLTKPTDQLPMNPYEASDTGTYL